MILLIGIILLFIAVIVFVVFCAKETHWLNLVGICLVFLFAVFYLTMAGMVLETNSNWKQVLENNQKKLEAQEEQLEVALTGEPTDFEWPHDSLKGLETEAAQQVLGQGRVWRQCQPGAYTPGANPNDLTTGSLTVNLPPNSPAFKADPDPNAAAADPAAESISLVYVFLEVPDGEGGYQISNYIGSFFATEPADDNTSVKLTPSLILPDPANAQELKATNPNYKTARELLQGAGDPETRWAMYDILPVDTYDVFVDSIRAEAGDPDLEVTPEMLQEKLVSEYMPIELLRLQSNPEKYKQIIDSIVFTNQPEQVYDAAGFEPLDDEKWYRVQFKRAFKNESFKVDFDSDGDTQRAIALEGQAYDRDGLALLEILKLGEEVKFDKDQTVLLDHLSWEKNPESFIKSMKDAGEAVVTEVIYRRKLNDFDYDFRALVAFNKQLTSDRDHAQEKVDQLQEINTRYEMQKAIRDAEGKKLTADVNRFKEDQAAIEQYRGKLEEELASERSEIDRYFRLTKELAAQKAELQKKLSRIIEEKTRQAETAAGDAQ